LACIDSYRSYGSVTPCYDLVEERGFNMRDLNRRKITRRDFLKFFGLSSASLFTSGVLADQLLAEVLSDVIPVVIMIKPNVFRYGRNDEFSSIVVFPEGYEVTEVDVSSVGCEGAHALDSILCPDSRTIVFLYNSSNLKTDLTHDLLVPFTVTGRLNDGSTFKGSDTVMIIGANQPTVYHISSRKHRSCNACKGHAVNRIYSSMQKADNDRAHPGCNCRIVAEQIGWRDYVKAFWSSSQGGESVYDRRWGWPPPSPKGLSLEYPLCLEEHLRRG